MKKEPIIQVKNASKSYPIAGNEFMALKQIDLSLNILESFIVSFIGLDLWPSSSLANKLGIKKFPVWAVWIESKVITLGCFLINDFIE